MDNTRTKTARKKRKSSDTHPTVPSTGTTSRSTSTNKKPRTSIQFVVPSLSGSCQDQQSFGLIEGMSGGEREYKRKRRGSSTTLPHRGRLIEIPGSILPGKWETLILTDDSDAAEGGVGLDSLRLSLRHNSAPVSSLETYYTGEESAPDGHVISLLNPSINRIDQFTKQGILTEDEVKYGIEDEKKMLNGFFLSCLSLVTFGGFLSASEVCTMPPLASY